jgi:hypothetical protein
VARIRKYEGWEKATRLRGLGFSVKKIQEQILALFKKPVDFFGPRSKILAKDGIY